MNATHAEGTLIAEIVCHHPPIDSHATSACANFHSDIAIPKLGDRVRITGVYVIDTGGGWAEIHPISRIEVIP